MKLYYAMEQTQLGWVVQAYQQQAGRVVLLTRVVGHNPTDAIARATAQVTGAV